MKPLKTDLSAFKKLYSLRPPVGVRFLFFKPEGIKPLPKSKVLSFCEMLVEAHQASAPFYISKSNEQAYIGKILLGMEKMELSPKAGR